MNTAATTLLADLKRRLDDDFALVRNARVAIAADPAHAMELLSAGRPGGVAVVLFYMGDVPSADTDLPLDTAVQGRIRIGVIRHVGLAAKPGREVPTALEDAEVMRMIMAGIVDAGTLTGGYEYGGMTYVSTAAGELLHGYIIDYTALYAYQVPEED